MPARTLSPEGDGLWDPTSVVEGNEIFLQGVDTYPYQTHFKNREAQKRKFKEDNIC